MSISPQKDGFQSSTGSGPFARGNAAMIPSKLPCPAFAIVSLTFNEPVATVRIFVIQRSQNGR
jgi:hypothetical protein